MNKYIATLKFNEKQGSQAGVEWETDFEFKTPSIKVAERKIKSMFEYTCYVVKVVKEEN